MDVLYSSIESLQALRINFSSVDPEFRGKEKSWVEKMAWSLRLLQSRKNFALTFTVEEKVIPWLSLPRSLPFELQMQVLDYLEWDESDYRIGSREQTLVSCCLVCRAWRSICQRALLRTISLQTHRQLQSLREALSSATHSSTYTTKLSLNNREHIYRVAPIYLATKLLCLRHLLVLGPFGGNTPFVFHSSIIMHLKHFRTITELRLLHITFQSFWDFRRFVVALPALSRLHMMEVGLSGSDPFLGRNGRIPSLLLTPRNLTHVDQPIGSRYSEDWNPFWIWVAPLQSRRREPKNPQFRPSLTPRDANTIKELVELDSEVFHGAFDWSCNEKEGQCKWSLR